jgi:hypothetical protein
VLKLTGYAARAWVYPQFRDKLFRSAAEEQGYIRWLAEHITALGGQILQVRFPQDSAKTAGNVCSLCWKKRSATVQTE